MLQAERLLSPRWAGCARLWATWGHWPSGPAQLSFWWLLLGVDVPFPSKCRNKGDILFCWLQFDFFFFQRKCPKEPCVLELIPGSLILPNWGEGQSRTVLCNQLCQHQQQHDYRNQHQTLPIECANLLKRFQWNFNFIGNTRILCHYETFLLKHYGIRQNLLRPLLPILTPFPPVSRLYVNTYMPFSMWLHTHII